MYELQGRCLIKYYRVYSSYKEVLLQVNFVSESEAAVIWKPCSLMSLNQRLLYKHEAIT